MEKKWKSRKNRNKKRAGWSPFFYILVGVALFFGVVYGGELVFRVISSQGEEPSVPPASHEPTLSQTAEPAREEMEVTLYFANPEFTALVGEKRKVPRSETWLEDILKALLQGPRNNSLFNPIPPSTRLNAVFQDQEVVYVDLSEEMMRNQSGGTSQELLSVYAIVDTLTALPGIKMVKILINGKEELTLCGHIDISKPLERDEKLIAQVR
ncbi:MAG: GerMN domain-containing protein [Atribacterota bacterium]|nr:GerMN domain-containing protein [Atribacterota bacterium]